MTVPARLADEIIAILSPGVGRHAARLQVRLACSMAALNVDALKREDLIQVAQKLELIYQARFGKNVATVIKSKVLSIDRGNILLRPVTESDLPILYEQQLDPTATAMAEFPARDQDSFMAHWQKNMVDQAVTLQTVLVAERVAGSIVSWETTGKREVGYWFGREFWGKGIATRALQEFLKVEVRRPLYAHVAKGNIGSRRVLEKCGFKVLGEDKFINPAGQEVAEFVLKLE